MFLLLLLTSLIALVVLIIAGFYVLSTSSSNWMSDMWSHMGGMMGTSDITVQNPATPYFTVMFVVLVGVVIISAGGLAYFLVFPEIKTASQARSAHPVSVPSWMSTICNGKGAAGLKGLLKKPLFCRFHLYRDPGDAYGKYDSRPHARNRRVPHEIPGL